MKKKKTQWGLNSFGMRTPTWARMIIAITIPLTTAITYVVYNDNQITPDMKLHIMVYLKGFDLFVYGAMKGFGIPDVTKK
jgi:hypothetical protein